MWNSYETKDLQEPAESMSGTISLTFLQRLRAGQQYVQFFHQDLEALEPQNSIFHPSNYPITSIHLYGNSRGVTGLDSGSLGKFGPNDLIFESWELLSASFTPSLFMFKVLNYLSIFSITVYVFLAVSVALLISFYTFAGFPPRWSLCSSLMMLRALLGDLCAQEPTMVWRFLWSHSVEGWPINLVNDGQHHRAISRIWRHSDM